MSGLTSGLSKTVAASDRGEPLIRWKWIADHHQVILTALYQHIDLTWRAVLLGLVLSLPIAIVIRRFRWLQGPVLAISGILYTIPGIALLFILGPYTGYTRRSTIDIALVSYTLLILIRNIVTGLEEVSPDVREAAVGMGLSPLNVLFKVELPLALPAIVAGLRIATVTTIGLATFAAFVSQGGLGDLIINDGLDRQFPTEIIVGSVLAVGLAIVADVIFLVLQRLVSPWTRKAAAA
ncbi:MAG: binding-protein-dependent transport system inner rane component [Frankiales bacterium]|nr:binding-protein-dependent transport system inner rane component [Frankiales bacterium]